MVIPSRALNEARDRFIETLEVLRKSRGLYQKNKHRSVPNRGPYQYALKVAQQEFDAANTRLRRTLLHVEKSRQLRELRNEFRRNLSRTRNVAKAQPSSELINHNRRQREYLAKLQMIEALQNELFTEPKRVASAR